MLNKGYIIEDHMAAQHWLSDALRDAYPQIGISLASSLGEARTLLAAAYPDIALVDLNLPDGSGIELIEQINSEAPQTMIVVATIYDDDDYLFPALRAGANGYILKEQKKADISRLLKGIVNGEPPLSPAISQRMMRYFAGCEIQRETLPGHTLTEREREVLTHIAQGNSLAKVALILGVSRNTVATQVKSIYSKLNISSRAEAALAATNMGLVGRDGT